MERIRPARFFVTGGTLQPDAPSYVSRPADNQLFQGLLRGEFCYVLNARQMGKSSLMARTVRRLKDAGVRTAFLDISSIGHNTGVEQWYYGLASNLCSELGLADLLNEFWDSHHRLAPHQIWMLVLTDLVLKEVDAPIVVCVDEIDAVRSLPFKADEFFAGIRELYNRRSSAPELDRLTFCLLGVATPAELIDDPQITPFNVGTRISLTDFTFEEARVLSQGLNFGRDSYTLLQRVLYWTDGHPYLTQKLCKVISERSEVVSDKDVDDLCHELFLSPEGRDRDDNLLFVRRSLMDESFPGALLQTTYLRILKRPRASDSVGAPAVLAKLVLSGAVKVDGNKVRVRNRLYAGAFNRDWVLTNLPGFEQKRIRRAYRRGLLRAGLVGAAACAVFAGASFIALEEANGARTAKAQYRELFYKSSVKLAGQYFAQGELGEAEGLLDQIEAEDSQDRGWEWYRLKSEMHPDLPSIQVPMQPGGYASPAIAVLPDNRALLSRSGKLITWNYLTGEVQPFLARVSSPVSHLERINGGNQIAVSFDGDLQVFDVSSGRSTVKVTSTEWAITGFDTDASSRYAAVRMMSTIDSQYKVGLLRLSDGELLWSKPLERPLQAHLIPGTQSVAALSNGELYRLSKDQKPTAITLQGLGGSISGFTVNPEGTEVAAVSSTGETALFNLADGSVLKVLEHCDAGVRVLCFNADATQLGQISQSGLVSVFDLRSARRTHLQLPPSTSNSLAFDAQNRLLIGSDGRCSVWDPRSRPLDWMAKVDVQNQEQPLIGYSSATNNLLYAEVPGSSEVEAWNLETGQRTISESQTLATCRNGTSAILEGSVVRILSPTEAPWAVDVGPVLEAKLSANGALLGVLTQQDKLLIFDASTHVQLSELTDVCDFDIAPDGSRVVATRSDLQSKVATDYKAHLPPEVQREIRSRADLVRTVLGGSMHRLVGWTTELWDRKSGWKSILEDSCRYPVFTPDGTEIWIVTYLRTLGRKIQIIDAASGAPKHAITLTGNASCWAIGFTPDGTRELEGWNDGTVQVRDRESRQILCELKPEPPLGAAVSTSVPASFISSVGCSADGHSIFATYNDGTIYAWRNVPRSASHIP